MTRSDAGRQKPRSAAATAAGSILAAGLMALCAAAAASAQSPAVADKGASVRSALDQTFGAGRWRETSGYRSRAREDELRREGAGTVPAGRVSHHSMGSATAPGAYDVVVDGVPTAVAAARLERASAGFSRVIAEGAHGREGPHLHIEPGAALAAGAAPQPAAEATIYERIVSGRRNPLIEDSPLAGGPR